MGTNPMKSTSLYSEEQIRAAEKYLKEVGADDLSLDSRHGRTSRPESLRVLNPEERGIRVLKDARMDFFAKDRLALVVPHYTRQLPLGWTRPGFRIVVMRRFADEELGVRQILEGLVTKAAEAQRGDDPDQALVLIIQVSRQREFEPGEHPG
ncbi:hypothetical protein AUR63_04380 [Guyparkeria sp. XI15]|nr:hypothetical protein AUR63_04380 [Guyparkeria sp. XI15]OAE84936.1 hypothetical protein AWR35_04390 [Guyparkeria sp. WRN-7]